MKYVYCIVVDTTAAGQAEYQCVITSNGRVVPSTIHPEGMYLHVCVSVCLLSSSQ